MTPSWESARDRWERAGRHPISLGCAVLGFGVCIAILATTLFWLLVPRG